MAVDEPDMSTDGIELLSADPGASGEDRVERADDLLEDRSLTAVGRGFRIAGGKTASPPLFVRVAFDPAEVPWIDAPTIRFVRLSQDRDRTRTVWQSGANLGLGYLWARVDEHGEYAAVGLPKDRLLLELLRQLATRRRSGGPAARPVHREVRQLLTGLVEQGDDDIEQIREQLAITEFTHGTDRYREATVNRGKDYGIVGPLLPGGVETFDDLVDVIGGLDPLPGGLPEEDLFFPPQGFEPLPWPPFPRPRPLPWPPELDIPRIPRIPWIPDWEHLRCLLVGSRDWPMYQQDPQHTGRASCSSIDASTVSTLRERHHQPLDGDIASQPAVVGGHAYVGTMDASAAGAGGFLYKIELATGTIVDTFAVSTRAGRHGAGIASTPAIVAGKVYLSSLSGHLYRVDAGTMTQDWVVDLRAPDPAHNQPVTSSSLYAAGWSSPVVANGRVYVGHGEGETGGHGYVFCVDASSGDVVWLFCTTKFTDPTNAGNENQPNVIPPADWAGPGSPSSPYSVATNNPSHQGSAPWSSVAYDSGLDRVYVGTGNADPDDPLPDPRYASGCISLDATTGQFEGFFQPAKSDSYRPDVDFDVDVPGGPTIFTRDGKRLVGIGSKNGSYFLLDADGLTVEERRQLLPYDDAGDPLPNVDPPDNNTTRRENKSGVFGTATVDVSREALFVGLGGYSGSVWDHTTTPFIRAMHWGDLADTWPTAGTNPPKYSMAQPPVYTTDGETGLTNVTSVNDVVFVGTTKPGLYALDADTGFCLWTAGWPSGHGAYCFGAAISGDYVVAGTGNHLHIYSL